MAKRDGNDVTELKPATPTRLSNDELAQLKLANLEEENRALNRIVMERDIRIATLEAEVCRQKSEVMRHRLLIMKQEHTDKLQAHVNWWNETKARFGVKEGDKFGYSPESGDVTITKQDSGG